MKKTLITTIASALAGCGTATTTTSITTSSQDVETLQKHYETVYSVSLTRYICLDSTGVYDIRMTADGKISSKVKIK